MAEITNKARNCRQRYVRLLREEIPGLRITHDAKDLLLWIVKELVERLFEATSRPSKQIQASDIQKAIREDPALRDLFRGTVFRGHRIPTVFVADRFPSREKFMKNAKKRKNKKSS